MLLCLSVSAEAGNIRTARVGFLTRLNTSEEDFRNIVEDSESTKWWHLVSNRHEISWVKFYDSLTGMQMALGRKEVDEIALPEAVGEYLLKNNPDFETSCVVVMGSTISLAFGFRKDSPALAEKFNRAIRAIEDDFKLAELQGVYIYGDNISKPVEFTKFDDAETVKVAVTGDLPPIDYVDEAGNAAGFNAALLAELGRRMNVNIELVNVESASRTAALMSGRVDVVFWYETSRDRKWKYDVPEDVILSEPYYGWNKFLHLEKK